MVTKRRGKRKSDSKNLVFEVRDSDVSTDDSDNESNEPQRKVLKTNSTFVESVVNALSNLENENKIVTQASHSNDDKKEIIEIDESTDEITEQCSENEDNITQASHSNNDKQESIEIDESNNKITEQCSENEDKITQASNTDEEIIHLDDSTDENTKKFEKEVESVIVIGEDTLCESSIQDVDNSLIVLGDTCSTSYLECGGYNKDSEESLGYTSPNICLEKSVITDIEDGELTAEIDNVDAAESGIYITFSSKSICDLYKSRFLDFLNTCTDLSIVKQDDLTITVLKDSRKHLVTTLDETKNNDNQIDFAPKDQLQEDKSPKRKRKRKRAKKEKELFTLDTKPSENVNHVTQYSSKFQISENGIEEVPVSLQTCFNCDQNHALKDCPLPRNFAKINQMRQQFKMMKEKHTSRYHLEEDQKYDHLKPGIITNKLREALGLKSNQVPSYIYQMRILGYPPGWLEEAKLFYSNLALFDTDGKHVQIENVTKNQALDPNKIIEYPGFNAPLDKHSKDEYRLHRVPSYSAKFSKSSMIEYFEKEYSKQQDDFETLDMDLDGKNVDDEKECNILTCLPKDLEKDVQSPSLLDLETQKQNLLAALDDNSSSNLKSEDTTEKEPVPPGLKSEDELSKNQTDKSDQTISDITLELPETNCLVSPSKTTNNSILNSDFGTPILKSCSPFSSLPNPNNFMKDVSPVINFENLPNTTGKYEQMTGLLQKVRGTLKNIQKNN